jgi:hypothetical protein
MWPLILENVCQATGLQKSDVFAVPISLQVQSPQKKDNLTVMVEEQVISVMYNQATVSPSVRMKALSSLGLADSTTCVRVLLRGIMVEYILDPDVIQTNPVPSINKVNMVMIPMESGTCGLRLAALLIESGTILLQNLLHLVVLPYNTHGRFEFRFQRLYVFLAINTMFKDTIATMYSAITDILCHETTKQFFKSEYLPGVQQALSAEGTWSINRSLLLNLPRTSLLVATPRLFPTNSVAAPTTSESISNPSDISSPSSIQPNDLTGDFQVSTFTQGEKLLQSNDRIYLAIEALTALMMRVHTPAPGSNGGSS